MRRIFVVAVLVVIIAQNAAAEGIPCWVRCHHPPKINSASGVGGALRRSANPPLNHLARVSGILTTYLGKVLGVQGWKDYHLSATVKGRVVHAAGSTDFLYTIDLQIEQLWIEGSAVPLAAGSRFIRAEVFPFARIGAPLPVRENQGVCISGKLMWDADGFLEVHPKKRVDFLDSRCR